eukprot:3455032-Rhodomonas_salina.2
MARLGSDAIVPPFPREKKSNAGKTHVRTVWTRPRKISNTWKRIPSTVKLLQADPRFTLTLWGEAMPQDEVSLPGYGRHGPQGAMVTASSWLLALAYT